MIFENLPYPNLVNINHTADPADAMLQYYTLARNENIFYKLSNQTFHPKGIIIATQALDNILHISLNYCNDVNMDQVEQGLSSVNWTYPDFEKIDRDIIPLVLVKLLLGVMKIHIDTQLLTNWNAFTKKYADKLKNR